MPCGEYQMNLKKQDITEIKGYIHSCHIMTLGTYDSSSVWTAPVYYIYFGSGFYFFSKKSSRHIENGMVSRTVAASIHHHPDGWADIKGIQMEGTLVPAGHGPRSIQAFKAYLKRFSEIKDLIRTPFSGSLDQFREQFKVGWYRFEPETMIYLDNSVKFGYSVEVLSS